MAFCPVLSTACGVGDGVRPSLGWKREAARTFATAPSHELTPFSMPLTVCNNDDGPHLLKNPGYIPHVTAIRDDDDDDRR